MGNHQNGKVGVAYIEVRAGIEEHDKIQAQLAAALALDAVKRLGWEFVVELVAVRAVSFENGGAKPASPSLVIYHPPLPDTDLTREDEERATAFHQATAGLADLFQIRVRLISSEAKEPEETGTSDE